MQNKSKQALRHIRRPAASSLTTLSSSSSSAMDRYLHQLQREASERCHTPISTIVIEKDNPCMIPAFMSHSFSSHLDRSSCENLDVSFREERWESPEHILPSHGICSHSKLSKRRVRSKQKRLPPLPMRQESLDPDAMG